MLHSEQKYQSRIQDSEGKIPVEEPVFLLRAQDVTAADTVRFWVKQQRKLLKNAKNLSPEAKAARRRKIELAAAHAHRMDDWPHKKTAD